MSTKITIVFVRTIYLRSSQLFCETRENVISDPKKSHSLVEKYCTLLCTSAYTCAQVNSILNKWIFRKITKPIQLLLFQYCPKQLASSMTQLVTWPLLAPSHIIKSFCDLLLKGNIDFLAFLKAPSILSSITSR